MSVTVRDFLITAGRVIEQGILPNVVDKYSRTQLLAVMQALELSQELHDKQGQALFLQNADLWALCDMVEDTIRKHPVAGLDTELRDLMAAVRRCAGSTGVSYPTISQLAEINAELRTCFAAVIRILSRREFRALPAYQAVRARARDIFSDSYGLELVYRPVWVS